MCRGFSAFEMILARMLLLKQTKICYKPRKKNEIDLFLAANFFVGIWLKSFAVLFKRLLHVLQMIKWVEFCNWDIFHFSNDRRCFKLYVISNFVDISVNLRKVDQWDNKNSLRVLITWSTELLITVCCPKPRLSHYNVLS